MDIPVTSFVHLFFLIFFLVFFVSTRFMFLLIVHLLHTPHPHTHADVPFALCLLPFALCPSCCYSQGPGTLILKKTTGIRACLFRCAPSSTVHSIFLHFFFFYFALTCIWSCGMHSLFPIVACIHTHGQRDKEEDEEQRGGSVTREEWYANAPPWKNDMFFLYNCCCLCSS